MKFTLATTLFFAASASAAVPSLTPDNYDSLTAGKTVFIKFFAPWCGHCKTMAPDWVKLSAKWTDSDVGMVAEVDCTAEGKPLCDANGVKGFPTLKFGDPAALDDYSGARTYDALDKFADENLIPSCSISNIDLCSDEKKASIEKYQAMDAADLATAITAEEAKLDEAESTFKAEVEKLQSTYQSLMDTKDKAQAEVKASGLGLMKAVAASAAKKAGSDEL